MLTSIYPTPANRRILMPPLRKRGAGKTVAPMDSLPWSECRRYAACSLQWRLSRTRRVESVSAGLVFGSSFQAAMAAYYRARGEGRALAAPELLAVFQRRWAEEVSGAAAGGAPVPIRYGSADGGEVEQFALAERMLDVFLASRVDTEVVAVGKEFRVMLAPDLPPVTGHIDLLEIRRDADGVRRLHLVKWKTASRKPAAGEIDLDTLVLHTEAVRRLGLLDAFALPLVLWYETFTKCRKSEVLSLPAEPPPNAVERLVEKIRQYRRGMAAGVCYPNPSWRCGGCGHAGACARWPETAAPILARPAAIPA